MSLKKFICIEDHWVPGFECDENYLIKKGTILEAINYSYILKIPLYQLQSEDRITDALTATYYALPSSIILDDPKYYECVYKHIRNKKIDNILNSTTITYNNETIHDENH